MKKTAFIVSQFPCYDEAFILREIHQLNAQMDILIFSLKKSKDPIIHDQAKELLDKTVYVPFFFSTDILGAFLYALLRYPRRFFVALFRLIIGNIRSPEFLFKSLAFFPKSVYLAKWIKENKIEHLHAYWATYPTSVALVASEISKVPFSFMGHAHDIYLDTTHLREKMKFAKFISTCTSSNKDYLARLAPDCSPDKILIQYHGLDLNQFDTNGKKRNKTFEILSVGTLNFYKGFNFLLDAVSVLDKKGLDFHCTIIGGGPLEEELRRHIKLLKIDHRVTMTGPLKQNEVIPYYKKADTFVLMAQSEWHWGIPNVLIESLAAKTPVITTRFGSVEELVHDQQTGVIVPPKQADTLAEAIEKYYNDEEYRQKLVLAGHKFVIENFDLNKNLEAFKQQVAHA